MHICFATIDKHSSNSGGGIASYVHAVSTVFIEQGHKVSVIARSKSGGWEWRQEGGLTILAVPFGNLHWYLYRSRILGVATHSVREYEWSHALNAGIRELHAKHPIDIAETSEIGIQHLSAWEELDIRTVVRVHGDPYVFKKYSKKPIGTGLKIARKLQLHAISKAATVTSPSQFQATEIEADLGWERGRIKVIPNPISQQMLHAAHRPYHQAKSHASDEKKDQIVLYTGRIEYRKGSLVLLDAVPRVLEVCPNTRFVLAGARHNSIDPSTLEKALQRTHAVDRISCLGHRPWHELIELYRTADVFVMPSYYETFGISVIEAMAFGLPVVATNAGGLPEVVEDGVTGLLVAPGDSEALAEALISLLANSKVRQKMGNEGRERVERFFVDDIVANKLIAAYENVL